MASKKERKKKEKKKKKKSEERAGHGTGSQLRISVYKKFFILFSGEESALLSSEMFATYISCFR